MLPAETYAGIEVPGVPGEVEALEPPWVGVGGYKPLMVADCFKATGG